MLAIGSAVLAATIIGSSAGSAVDSPSGSPADFNTSSSNSRPSLGQLLDPKLVHTITGSSVSAGTGFGSLAVFQEASVGKLAVSVGGAAPLNLSSGDFQYGLVPAGSYRVSASQGHSTVATGTVVVGAGQYVTALIYLAVGGVPTITGFANDQSSPPIGQSRVVLRNTANVGPVDFYVNGTKVASALSNTPNSPQSVSLLVPTHQITVTAVLAGHPAGNYLFAESGVLLAGELLNVFVVGDSTANPSTVGFLTNANPLGVGYRLYAADGGTFDFGVAGYYGSMGGKHLNKPIVGAAPSSLGRGYWMVASDGGIFTFGDASFWGSAGDIKLNKPVVGMAPTHDGGGYWLVASDGGIFTYGDATYYGSMGGTVLNKPIVGIATTSDGKGYWLIASDGGVFSFGDAHYFGSTGGSPLNQPIVAMVPTVDAKGYWLIASDGGVFSFGDAAFHGSTGGMVLNKPIVSAISTSDSLGYWLVASDGGIFSFGDAKFYGSTGAIRLNQPIVWGSAPGALLPS